MLFFHLSDENEAEMKEKAAEDEDDSGNSDDEEEDDDEVITEIRFVPSDKAACEWSLKPQQRPDVSQRGTGIFWCCESILNRFYESEMIFRWQTTWGIRC